MKEPDWDRIEADYRAGVMTIEAIAVKHGVTIRAIDGAASLHEWKRNRPDARAVFGYAASITPPESVPKSPIDSVFGEGEIQSLAVRQASSVLLLHREDLSRLRSIAATMSERLQLLLDGEENMRPFIGPRESPADLLEKLSRVTLRVIGLERQAFGMDVLLEPDLGETDDSDVLQVDERARRIEELAARLGYKRADG